MNCRVAEFNKEKKVLTHLIEETAASLFLSVRSRDYTAMKYMSPIQLRQCLCKAIPGSVMALNVGTEYLGVAMSDLESKALDENRDSLVPLNDKSGKPKSYAAIASELKKLIDRNNVKGMVIGKLDLEELDSHRLPSSDVQAAKKFVQKLAKTNIISDMNYTLVPSRAQLTLEKFLDKYR